MENKYFINCTPDNLVAFAKALLHQVNETWQVNSTPEDIVQEYCGDTSVEQVWENKNWVAMLSTDSCITVLNIVNKHDCTEMSSVEVD